MDIDRIKEILLEKYSKHTEFKNAKLCDNEKT
jgi:hypothetical protein